MAINKRTFTYLQLNNDIILKDSCAQMDLTKEHLTCVVGPIGLEPDKSVSYYSGICLNPDGSLLGNASGLIGRKANVRFPCDPGKWSVTFGSPYHKVRGGIGGADDTFAIDLNLNKPKYNADKGKNVYAVEDGRIVYTKTACGFVLIRHDSMLVTDDRENISPWYSGYLHMSSVVIKVGDGIKKGSSVGKISSEGMAGGKIKPNAHLHFSIYRGYYAGTGNALGELQSIDIKSRIKNISSGVKNWFYLEDENTKKVYTSKFIKDVNYLDNCIVSPKFILNKEWKIQNIGESIWQLVTVKPKNELAKKLTKGTPLVKDIEPGVIAIIRATIETPKKPGVYKLEYILSCPEKDFGGIFYTLFKVS